MENILSLIVPVLLVFLLLRIIAMPVWLGVKVLVNSACGFVCLWLLNWIAGFTGIFFPINPVTVIIAGFLGLPGIVLLAVSQFIL